MSSEPERRRVRYRGRVQGVGFRYTTVSVARAFAVSGYVRNLPDGSVEVVVEGFAPALERFLSAVAGRLGDFIEQQQTSYEPATGEFAAFTIQY